jgi:single-strand DNA-binding protein
MAASFNKVILMGNLTRDPETRVTPTGLTICKLGLAVNRNYTGQDGERKEETTFVDCDAFGKPAEIIARYMAKGRGILIEGRLRLDQWEDKQSGQPRSRLGVVVENFQFVGGRGAEGEGGEGGAGGGGYEDRSPPARQAQPQQGRGNYGGGSGGTRPQRSQPPPPPQENESFDDDVPF